MPDHPEQTINVDIAIIGGGIAGLWLLNRLVSAGYNAILFEQSALSGSDQTVASQGMIHGGIKYTPGRNTERGIRSHRGYAGPLARLLKR
ncbi:MAG: FAD-dependent oxidoreductase [Porticoccaceae bacterium]